MAKLELKLRSFLPRDKVVFKDNLEERVTFDGDKRKKADYNSNAYRTSQRFVIDTSKKDYGVQDFKDVGITTSHHYNSRGKLLEVRKNQAPNGNLKFTKRIENDDLYLSCSCAINNPSVWYSPDIKYNLEIKVTRTGSVRLTGKHGQFPAFEFGRHQISAKKAPENIWSYIPKDSAGVFDLYKPSVSVDVGRPYNSDKNN